MALVGQAFVRGAYSVIFWALLCHHTFVGRMNAALEISDWCRVWSAQLGVTCAEGLGHCHVGILKVSSVI